MIPENNKTRKPLTKKIDKKNDKKTDKKNQKICNVTYFQ